MIAPVIVSLKRVQYRVLELLIQPLLAFLIGGAATFMFVATGGVGLITTPSLIFLGLSPQAAIATDLFAMLGGRLGGLIGFRKTSQIDFKLAATATAVACVGALVGAQILLAVDESLMRKALGWILIVLLVFLVMKPAVGQEKVAPKTWQIYLGYSLFFLVGLWGTLIGAGVISLGSAVMLFLFHKTFIETAALLTIIGLGIGLVGMVVFGINQVIDWPIGIALLLGKYLGGYFGSMTAVKVGDKWIRWLFIFVVLVSGVGLSLTD